MSHARKVLSVTLLPEANQVEASDHLQKVIDAYHEKHGHDTPLEFKVIDAQPTDRGMTSIIHIDEAAYYKVDDTYTQDLPHTDINPDTGEQIADRNWASPEQSGDPAPFVEVQSPLQIAMGVLVGQLRKDPDLAWLWQCNIAMVAHDKGLSHQKANEAAANFLYNLTLAGDDDAEDMQPVRMWEHPYYQDFIPKWKEQDGNLPADHWIHKVDTATVSPALDQLMATGVATRDYLRTALTHSARQAIAAATARGENKDFDPDALVQNVITFSLGFDLSALQASRENLVDNFGQLGATVETIPDNVPGDGEAS